MATAPKALQPPSDESQAWELPADAAQAVGRGARVMLTHDGATVAALVPLEDLRRLEEIEAEEDRLDAEEAERAMADIRAGREHTVPLDRVLTELGLATPTTGLDMFIAMAGTVRSGEHDVSSDKYRHLAEAYAAKP